MTLKNSLAVVCVAILATVGSVSAEEATTKQMNTMEIEGEKALKDNSKSDAEKANAAKEKSVKKTSSADVKKSLPKKVKKQSSPRNNRVKREAQSGLDPTEQAQLEANIADIAAVQNQGLLSQYANSWPVSLRDVVQVCDAFCREPENTDGCGLVAGITGVNDLMIPSDRTSFLTCFHEGTDKINEVEDTNGDVDILYGGICDDDCSGNFLSNKCGVAERRTACKLLCCSQSDTITHCLSHNNDTCINYE